MKAIVQDQYGGPETLRLEQVPAPVPEPDEMLVEVRAASVNAADWHMMRGDPWLARLAAPELGLRRPKVGVRGRDLAGVVRQVGAQVTDFAVGDEVYGELSQGGSLAELVAVPPATFAPKPSNLSFVEAAAVPLAGVTALMAVRDKAGVAAGQRVLVVGASGGVGTFAVQLAADTGAQVTAVCSTRNVDQARELGAVEVIDYTRTDVTSGGVEYDAVIAVSTTHSLSALRRLVKPGGTLVIVGGDSMWLLVRGALAGRFGRRRVTVLMATQSRSHLEDLRALIEAGRIRPVVEATYPLDRAADAIEHLETRGAKAKIVVTANDD